MLPQDKIHYNMLCSSLRLILIISHMYMHILCCLLHAYMKYTETRVDTYFISLFTGIYIKSDVVVLDIISV